MMVMSRSRRAFTLIEVMVSLLLSAILMIAVFHSLRASLLTARWAESKQASAASTQLLREMIRRDVSQAIGIQVRSGDLSLFGPLATDASTRLPTLRDAVVRYRLQSVNGQRTLVRSEVLAGGRLSGRPQEDVLWVGVDRFEVQALSESEDGEGESLVARAMPLGFEALATHLKVELEGIGGRSLISEMVMNHLEAGP